MDRLQHVWFMFALGSLANMVAPVEAATPTPEKALALKPVQEGVEYDRVDPAMRADCKVIDLDRGDWSGWEVIAKDGTLLRRFADTNGDQQGDQGAPRTAGVPACQRVEWVVSHQNWK